MTSNVERQKTVTDLRKSNTKIIVIVFESLTTSKLSLTYLSQTLADYLLIQNVQH